MTVIYSKYYLKIQYSDLNIQLSTHLLLIYNQHQGDALDDCLPDLHVPF